MIKPVLYKQTDPRWKANDYSANGEKTTIGAEGCGITCMAMVIATLKDPKVTPADTAKWSLEHGYKALKSGTYYTYFVPQGKVYGITIERVNLSNLRGQDATTMHEKAFQAVKNGDWVICCMGPSHWTTSGHYILWYGMDGNNVLINDPYSDKPDRAEAPLSLLQAQVKYYWIVKVPKPNPTIKVVAGVTFTSGYIENGVSYSPVRYVAEAFGHSIGWNDTTKTVTVDGKPIEVVLKDGTAYAKSRTIADTLGLAVSWDEATRTVTFK